MLGLHFLDRRLFKGAEVI